MAATSFLWLLLAATVAFRTSLADSLPSSSARFTALDAALQQNLASALARFYSSLEATDDAPSGYRPAAVRCPAERPAIREGRHLSPQERRWLPHRRRETAPHIRDLLGRIKIPDFDSDAYLGEDEALPNIGIAVSGGGYRALLNGAGVLAAFDARSNGRLKSPLGGLLQSATYVSGLSGGAWLVGSLFSNNFTSVQESLASPNVWRFQTDILGHTKSSSSASDSSDQSLASIATRLGEILKDVSQKHKAGFPTSITDFWGRALSYQLVDAPRGGPGFTFSSIADDEDFYSAKTPLPLLTADARSPGETLVPANATIFEFSPWEMGSFDRSVDGFAPLKYVGSRFDRGRLPRNEECISGFDNTGFVMGTSSSLFNQLVAMFSPGSGSEPSQASSKALFELLKIIIPEALKSVVDPILDQLEAESNWDIAIWAPNPFKGWKENAAGQADRLMLVDGGEDGQNIPFSSHLVRERNVDVVFAIDSSFDTDTRWPNGTAMVATYRRSRATESRNMVFPSVPSTNTFVNLGLNNKPTFFGCDAANSSSPSPLIVYMPNAPYVYASNISTFTALSFTTSERDALVQNGWALGTQLDSTLDADWPVCVGCASLARSFSRTRTALPAKCRECFERYCWNGTVDEADPGPYLPELRGEAIEV